MKLAGLVLVVLAGLVAIIGLARMHGSSTSAALEPDPGHALHGSSIDSGFNFPGLSRVAAAPIVEHEADASIAPTLHTSAAMAHLRVRVVSAADGSPLSGVPIGIDWPEHVNVSAQVPTFDFALVPQSAGFHAADALWRTGDDGWVQIDISAGIPLSVSVDASESHLASEAISIGALAKDETRSVTLVARAQEEFVFCGRVLDASTRGPISSIRVTILSGAPSEDMKAVILTDDSGHFALNVRQWHRNETVLFLHPSTYAETYVVAVSGHDTPESALDVLLSRAAKLTVTLLDATEVPISGARIEAVIQRHELTQPRGAASKYLQGEAEEDWHAETDAQGVASVTDLPVRAPLSMRAVRGAETLHVELLPIVLDTRETREVTWRVDADRGAK